MPKPAAILKQLQAAIRRGRFGAEEIQKIGARIQEIKALNVAALSLDQQIAILKEQEGLIDQLTRATQIVESASAELDELKPHIDALNKGNPAHG